MAEPEATTNAGVTERTVGNTTPTPMELMRQGLEGQPQQAEEQDPWAPLGEKAKQIAEAKGWQGPEEMLKAYEAATTRLSQRDEEKEALLAEIARLEQERTAPAAQQQHTENGNGQVAPFDFDALAFQLVDPNTGEPNLGRMMEMASAIGAQMAFQAAEQRMSERFAQFESERVAPLSQRAEEERMQAELDELEATYGDDVYKQIEARVLERVDADPDYVDRLGGVRGAFATALYELQQEELQQAQQAAQSHTLRSGGRRPAAPTLSPEQAELAAMERARWRPNDGF